MSRAEIDVDGGAATAEGIAPKDRGGHLLRWRTTLGWSVAEVADRLGVSTRTISAFESGSQTMPDPRWRLFVHEMRAEINQGRASDLVVVLAVADHGAFQEQRPIDVVSSENYAGHAISDDGKRGMIASYAIDRISGRASLRRQQFLVEHNQHVLAAIERWEDVRRATASDRTAYEVHRWLTRRALYGELAIPGLTPLKEEVSRLSDEVSAEANDDARAKLQRKLDANIAELIEVVAKNTGR
jgi:DNA-binding XRE family transcriptional regulator